jgi:hypothetical protein
LSPIFCYKYNKITTFLWHGTHLLLQAKQNNKILIIRDCSPPPHKIDQFRRTSRCNLSKQITYCFSLNICWGSPFLLALTVLVVIAGFALFGPPSGDGLFIFRWLTPFLHVFLMPIKIIFFLHVLLMPIKIIFNRYFSHVEGQKSGKSSQKWHSWKNLATA